jgi:hypothetical protein
MFQKLPLIIRKYDKGLQVDKRSKSDTKVTTATIQSFLALFLVFLLALGLYRPTGKYQ